MLTGTGSHTGLAAATLLADREDWTVPVQRSGRDGLRERSISAEDSPKEHPIWVLNRLANSSYAASVEGQYERMAEPGERAWQKLLRDGPKPTGDLVKDARASANFLEQVARDGNDEACYLLLRSVLAFKFIAGGCPVDAPFLKGGAAGFCFQETDAIRLAPLMVFLIRDGGPLEHRRGELEGLAMTTVGRTNDPELLQFFLDLGFSPNAKDAQGRTPLMRAGDVQSVKTLLAYGADPTIRSSNMDGNVVWDEWQRMADDRTSDRPNAAMLRRMDRAVVQALIKRDDDWAAWAAVPGVGPRTVNNWSKVVFNQVLPIPDGDRQAPSVWSAPISDGPTVQALPVLGAFLRVVLGQDTMGLNGVAGSTASIIEAMPAVDDPSWDAPFASGVWANGELRLLPLKSIGDEGKSVDRNSRPGVDDWPDGVVHTVSQREAFQAILVLTPEMKRPFGFQLQTAPGRSDWYSLVAATLNYLATDRPADTESATISPERAPRSLAVTAQALAHIRGGWPTFGVGGAVAHFAAEARRPGTPGKKPGQGGDGEHARDGRAFTIACAVFRQNTNDWMPRFRRALACENRAVAMLGHHAGVIRPGTTASEWVGGDLLAAAELVLAGDVSNNVKVSLGTALFVPFLSSGTHTHGLPGWPTYETRRSNPTGLWDSWTDTLIQNPTIFARIPKEMKLCRAVVSVSSAIDSSMESDFPNPKILDVVTRVSKLYRTLRDREQLRNAAGEIDTIDEDQGLLASGPTGERPARKM